MDENLHPESSGLPLQGPHRPAQHAGTLPADFLPLRLILQPTGMVVEMSHQDMIVGRHSDADVRLPLPDVSRRHCRFLFGNGNWVVMDLNSLNGVFVNEEPVSQATLKQGDRLRIGGYIFAVDLSRERSPLPNESEGETSGDPNVAHHLFHTRRPPATFTYRRRAS